MQMPSVSKEFWVFGGIILVLLVLGVCMQLFVFRQPSSFTDVSEEPQYVIPTEETPEDIFKTLPESAVLRVDWLGYTEVLSTSSMYHQWVKDARDRAYASSTPEVQQLFDREYDPNVDYYDGDPLARVHISRLGTISSPTEFSGKPVLVIDIPILTDGPGPSTDTMIVVPNDDTKTFTVLRVMLPQEIGQYSQEEKNALGSSQMLPVRACAEKWSFEQLGDGTLENTLHLIDGVGAYCGGLFERQVDVVVTFDTFDTVIQHPDGSGVLRYVRNLFPSRVFYNTLPGDMAGYISSLAHTTESGDIHFTYSFSHQGTRVYQYDKGGYGIKRADGLWILYQFEPYFLTSVGGEHKEAYPLAYVPDVMWNDGFNRDVSYKPGSSFEFSGCGGFTDPILDVVRLGDEKFNWFSVDSLVPVATTRRGESVYTFKNQKENKKVQELFLNTSGIFIGNDIEDISSYIQNLTVEQKQQFDAFVLAHPVFLFWQDMDKNWRSYIDASLYIPVECGKPVIYLYPTQTTDVNVQVAPNGGFTETIPEYPVGGWNVKAEPNGALTSYNDGQPYPYLFWEGHANGFEYSDKGFVFAQGDVESGMKDVLAQFGMNEQETADFLEFWLPKMSEKPYVFVTFADQRDFEAAAPLKITPKPDSTLRVFMYFQLLDEARTAEPLPIRPFVRKGFSVVEWGGVLQ